MHKIDIHSSTWKAVQEWIDLHLAEDRSAREKPMTDQRQLDRLLGGIKRMDDLLELPEKQKEHKPELESGVNFHIPPLSVNTKE